MHVGNTTCAGFQIMQGEQGVVAHVTLPPLSELSAYDKLELDFTLGCPGGHLPLFTSATPQMRQHLYSLYQKARLAAHLLRSVATMSLPSPGLFAPTNLGESPLTTCAARSYHRDQGECAMAHKTRLPHPGIPSQI